MTSGNDRSTLPIDMRWALAAAAFAVATGIFWCALAFWFREAIAASISLGTMAGRRGGPSTLFLVSAVVAGWISGWLAERTWHNVGWHLLVSTVGSAAISIGAGMVGLALLGDTVHPATSGLVVFSGLVFAVAGAVSVWYRSVR